MDLLASYDDGSSTPKGDRIREGSTEKPAETANSAMEEYRKMMESLRSNTGSKAASGPPNVSISDSSSDDSENENETDVNKAVSSTLRTSVSSDSSSISSSGSGSGKSDVSKCSDKKKTEQSTDTKDRKASHSKVDGRIQSCSESKARRRRRSSERHQHSRSREHRHKSSRSERKSNRRSCSRSKDRPTRRHSKDPRRKDGHRHRHSGSQDHHRRQSSPSHRHRHRSRSAERKKEHHSEKRRRSRSPRSSTSNKVEEASSNVTSVSSRSPGFKTAGVKFNRGRGTAAGSYKDKLKEEYILQVQQAQNVVDGHSEPMVDVLPPRTSSVATVSAGTGVMGPGGMNQVLINQMQQFRNMQSYVPGQPGVLTDEQKVINQRYLLQATGRTREQVEATYGIKIPGIYNENTNNLVEIAERSKKRSLLWQKTDKKKPETTGTFNAVTVLPGQNRSENMKFARLLGTMKGKPEAEEEKKKEETVETEAEEKALVENDILTTNLMSQYESSRFFTHFNRGVGLGYSTTAYQPH